LRAELQHCKSIKDCGLKPHEGRAGVKRKDGAYPKQLEKPMNIIKWKSSALVLGLVLLLSAPAFAHDHQGGGSGAAPEVDPSLAVAGISFLAGSLVVLRSRLRK
jgi:hypothetical protein